VERRGDPEVAASELKRRLDRAEAEAEKLARTPGPFAALWVLIVA
jgi:hypothetical protein